MKKSVLVYSVVGVLLILGVLALVLNYPSVTQSVLGVSSSYVGTDGKVYWILTGTANNIDEGYTFGLTTPTSYTKSDGSIVKPTSGVTLKFSKSASYCQYQLISQTYSACGGLLKVNYYELGNPERYALIKVTDGYSNSATLDGTIVSTKNITASNGGKLNIQTQGILAGKTDCPSPSSTIIVQKDGVLTPVKTSDLDYLRSQVTGVSCLNPANLINVAFFSRFSTNTAFTSAFNSYPQISSTGLRGDIDLGSGVFTITADQNYFNSVTILPPKQADPDITAINVPTLASGKTGSMSVTIANTGNEGQVSVEATSNAMSIYPSSQNVLLGTSTKTLYFQVTPTTTTTDKSSSVTIKVCSTGQFDSANCDTMSKTYLIKGSGSSVTAYCGDGVCQANENNATCSQDCLKVPTCADGYKLVNGVCVEDKACAWYESQSVSINYGLFGWRKLIGSPNTDVQCKLSSWVYLAVVGAIVLVLGLVLIVLLARRKR